MLWCRSAATGSDLRSRVMQAIAAEFAQDEANHVAWLQQNLGVAAIPMPQVRVSNQSPLDKQLRTPNACSLRAWANDPDAEEVLLQACL